MMEAGSSSPELPLPTAPPSLRAIERGFRLLWAATVLVPALIFAGAAYWSWEASERETKSRLEHIVDILHEHALRSFDTQEATLEAVDRRVAGMTPAQITGSREVHDFLAAVAKRARPSAGVAVVDQEGNILSSSAHFPAEGKIELTGEEIAHGRAGESSVSFVGDVRPNGPQNEFVFTLSQRTDSGLLVVASFKLRYFVEFYSSIAESRYDVILLIRADGAVLARVPELIDRAGYATRFHTSDFDETMEKGRLFAPAAPSPVDGRSRYYAARKVGPYPVLISYGHDAAIVRNAWLRSIAILGSVCAAAAALLMILTQGSQRAIRREHMAFAAASAEAKRRLEAEARLRHSQRMDALGQIAGGVAHDINNLTAAVMASARRIERNADDPDEVRRVVALVNAAAERGAKMTNRLLSFARRDDFMTALADVSHALRAAVELLAQTLGHRYQIVADIPDHLPISRGDRAELETVLINLVINARDAMPQGGVVRLAAAEETVSQRNGEGPAIAPGSYVRVTICDTGIGMDAATLARIGEAFFTTKAPGKGTGLGISMARAFAENAGGDLQIASEPNRGTTVTLRMAVAPEAVKA